MADDLRRDRHRLGYHQVDGDPDLDVLLSTMDATAAWEATRKLRAWERSQLRLSPGQRVLDVGCGLGDAALALAPDLAGSGEIVGVDISAEMVAAAAARAFGAPCAVRFEVGEACALAAPDQSFDRVRSERTLQWVDDPPAAVREMARVLRIGGLLTIIDTDWSTLVLDTGDAELRRKVTEAFRIERGRPSNVGGRLSRLVTQAGLEIVDHTHAVQQWSEWDPGAAPAPVGCFSMESLSDDLVDAGQIGPGERDVLVASVHRAAREGRFRMQLTMYGVVALRRA